ncbi:hypothetical protein [Thalassotalea crassostreae]|uniref:hypothetical protein n=1 Tax=Thalassotalea crassostreae TaxID=1763536 RepID=UPI0008380E82|nr:hypothetical protein [Thalassotalea crassostreae]
MTTQRDNKGRLIKGSSLNPKGRPKKTSKSLPLSLTKSAIKQLESALNNGEEWAIKEVLKRSIPTLKPIDNSELESLKTDLARLELISLQNSIRILESIGDEYE